MKAGFLFSSVAVLGVFQKTEGSGHKSLREAKFRGLTRMGRCEEGWRAPLKVRDFGL